MSNHILYSIAFSKIIGLSDKHRKLLLVHYGSAEFIYKERCNLDISFLDLHDNFRKILLKEWPWEEAEAEYAFMQKHQINATCIFDAEYPNRLIHCNDAPTVLYVKGNMNFNKNHLVSIVGSRQHTIQVNKIIQEITEGLAHLDIGIISGMAMGVDGIAHKTALQNKIPTWGVLAHGLDQIYPKQHRRLAIEMLELGGLITENKKGTIPIPYCFPKRNRIVAGMSDATIVIESDIQGGSMITAKLAFDNDRNVFAVPGKLHDPRSRGCLYLIKSNEAQIFYDIIDFLETMKWAMPAPNPNILSLKNPQLNLILDPESLSILEIIQQQGPIHPDEIFRQLTMIPGPFASHLLQLEMQDLVFKQAGNLYIRL
jgi:DNA processing protein